MIYAAAAEPGLWEPFLVAFAAAIETGMSTFWISRRQPQRPLVSASFGFSPAVLAEVVNPSFRDPWMSRVNLDTVDVGHILRSNEICPDEELIHDECYQRVCLPAGLHYGGGVMLERTATIAAGMSTSRPRAAGPLTEVQMATWRFLIPHLRAAVGLYARHSKVASERDALMRYFDEVGHGVLLVSAANEVLACNDLATAIVARGDCLRLERGGGTSLAALDPECDRLLQQAIILSAGGMSPAPVPVRLTLPRAAGRRGVMATVLPVGGAGSESAHLGPDAATAVIYLVDLESTGEFDVAPLRELFGFTEAEARLANAMATGISLAEAAGQFNVTIHTVRSHLQRALAKAGVNRQAELAILVLRMCRTQR